MQPTSLVIFTDGKINENIIQQVKNQVDLSPLGIIQRFGLGCPTPLDISTNYGHFGKEHLPWERDDL